MTTYVFLDTGVLGFLTHPKGSPDAIACAQWMIKVLGKGASVCVPEICDYELRREYVRLSSTSAIAKLDQLNTAIRYVPISTNMMQEAARLWAGVRNRGMTTAHPQAIDGDVILAAQALKTSSASDKLLVATTNVGHLSALSLDARLWRDIKETDI